VRKTEDKTESSGWAAILKLAQDRFGIHRFRPGQREVLEAVLAGKNALALMPTGAGKSLTYQLPALLLPKPVVVVSPLISLMQDQLEKAEQADVVVEKLDSTTRAEASERAAREIAKGSAQLIYVTPERLGDQGFLAELMKAGGVGLLVVDEAHTIAQWGNDFRPAFRAIGEARTRLGDPPVLALTATATEEVAEEILCSLHAEGAVRVATGIERENLALSVLPTVNQDAKIARVFAMVREEDGCGILYTASVRAANELYDLLTEHEISVGRYHGQMPAREREQVQREFMRGEHKVMIATKAFGLGIDKPDIRFVYHFEFPDSLETYYQEAGRAGRDGKPSKAVLLYRLEDKRIQTYFQAGRYPGAEDLEKIYQALLGIHGVEAKALAEAADIGLRRTQVILNLLTDAGLVRRDGKGYALSGGQAPSAEALVALLQTYVDRASHDRDRLAEMMRYAESPRCRFQILRVYFCEPEGPPCGRCDNCLRAAGDAGSGEAKGNETPARKEMPGAIRASAASTLPAAGDAAIKAGDQVRHKRFGRGRVIDREGENLLVAFERYGHKRVRASFLTAG
jgi:ATP-dependent DNA helicase RecQ